MEITEQSYDNSITLEDSNYIKKQKLKYNSWKQQAE